jgi:hypothetical protein
MRVLVDVVDAVGVERRRPADQAVHLVALAQQQLGEVAAILTGDTGDDGFFGLGLSHSGNSDVCIGA